MFRKYAAHAALAGASIVGGVLFSAHSSHAEELCKNGPPPCPALSPDMPSTYEGPATGVIAVITYPATVELARPVEAVRLETVEVAAAPPVKVPRPSKRRAAKRRAAVAPVLDPMIRLRLAVGPF